MKRVINIGFIAVMLLSISLFPVYALNKADIKSKSNSNSGYLAGGSYYLTEISENSKSENSVYSSSIKTGTKSKSFYDSNDTKKWTVTVKGTYSYNGTASSNTSATISYTIYDNKWRVTSATASKTGNKATGTFVVKRYVLGIPMQTENTSVDLACSASGVLS